MLRMNGNSPLEHTLPYILCEVNPSKDDWSFRFHLIEELRAVVNPIESLRGATVEPFGSFVSDLFTRWGDLDISIELANGSYISSAGKKQKQSLLEDVLKALRTKGGYRKLRLITGARVPVLKFQGKYNISCDVSINNLCGQMKSKLLYWISTIDERFRDMILLVKEWAKTHNINDSRNGTLNSYSLCLLVIFHFQTCEPAILPPLKELYPGNMVDDLTGVRLTAEKHIEDTCGECINRFRSNGPQTRNRSSLSDLFISFLAKFSDIGYKASEQGISTYTGQWEDIEANTRWLPKTYALFIEDPFEQPANTARCVTSTQLVYITEAFQATFTVLTSPNQDPNLLLATLTRPKIAYNVAGPPRNHINYYTRDDTKHQLGQNSLMSTPMRPQTSKFVAETSRNPQLTNFMVGTPSRSHGNNSGNGIRMHHTQRIMQPLLPHQFQGMRINCPQPNRAAPRPARDPPAQLQPVWRLKNDKKAAE